MLKTFAFPLVALMLIFSILAPSIITLVDRDCAIVALVDKNDEEKKQDKESEKKFSEKDLFLGKIETSSNYFLQGKKSVQKGYILKHSDYKAEILLPPPEQLI
ncbi:hypothetical protein [Flagellimonas nanhaiensis]|uniref:Uncharacterized protein n=1 Tax=Flagellimonas nanhaiensis TaxID=2292706 RepID=A0A371JQH7_9FLAO|nr:hypothetical protein [Allomuricauda nanhaiensis]RDY59673.1 hypothetical protein DX873_09905 [Allomuricauda nanhaiensis]